MKEPDDPTLRVYTPKRQRNRPDPGSAGQSGDDMGLPTDEEGGSESIAELVQEGQYFEAEAIEGAARPAVDEKKVRTREALDDDVPFEYPSRDPGLDTD